MPVLFPLTLPPCNWGFSLSLACYGVEYILAAFFCLFVQEAVILFFLSCLREHSGNDCGVKPEL